MFTRQASLLPAAITFNVQALPPMAHGASTAVAPSYSDTVQLLIPALLPPAMPAAGWTMQQPPYNQLTTQPTVYPMATDTLSPVPAQIRQKIIQGEFIDFSVLLHRATFPDATADPLPSAQHPIKKISSFVMWMQAWNLYQSVIPSHNPAKVLEMIRTLSVSNLLSHYTPATPKLASVQCQNLHFNSRQPTPLLGTKDI